LRWIFPPFSARLTLAVFVTRSSLKRSYPRDFDCGLQGFVDAALSLGVQRRSLTSALKFQAQLETAETRSPVLKMNFAILKQAPK
jgi:hypothetical protein